MNFTTDHQQQYPRQPTTGFVLIWTYQAGIVARTLLTMAVMNTGLNTFNWPLKKYLLITSALLMLILSHF